MKKTITVFLTLFVVITSFAQPGRYDRGNDRWTNRNDNSFRNERSNSSYNNAERERARLIFEINREFDARIRSVHNQWFMRSSEKAKKIRSLDIERDYRIRQVNERFYSTTKRGRW